MLRCFEIKIKLELFEIYKLKNLNQLQSSIKTYQKNFENFYHTSVFFCRFEDINGVNNDLKTILIFFVFSANHACQQLLELLKLK